MRSVSVSVCHAPGVKGSRFPSRRRSSGVWGAGAVTRKKVFVCAGRGGEPWALTLGTDSSTVGRWAGWELLRPDRDTGCGEGGQKSPSWATKPAVSLYCTWQPFCKTRSMYWDVCNCSHSVFPSWARTHPHKPHTTVTQRHTLAAGSQGFALTRRRASDTHSAASPLPPTSRRSGRTRRTPRPVCGAALLGSAPSQRLGTAARRAG